jgi:protein-L-isoaspartate O-methyltransferase
VKDGWWSYNPIAESYARAAEGLYFANPASDLLSSQHLAPGSRVLDVGTGTGGRSAVDRRPWVGPDGRRVY